MKKRLITTVLCVIALSAISFASASMKDDVAKDFNTRKSIKSVSKIFKALDGKMTEEQRFAMQFLYSYMPLPDISDYSSDFYLMNVDYALRTRKEMAWGSKVPDREFYHFVLPVRVNNENLDESRKVFFNELKDRVKGMSMRDAALEVNHWCHEKVVYRPSDSRTSSPLASVKTAYGRCGEESTFAVAAMRSVGIPARQVYTPRWAHTDDNHAWVEVWVDGKWEFLGACEPEPVLNLGWFNAPASRGMMMHTKAFGRYNGPEDVISSSKCFTEINVTSNYAPVSKVTVQTVDANGKPVKSMVSFKLYNYAELYPLTYNYTNENGYISITAGHGDLVVWADKDNMFGIQKISVGKQDTVVVKIDKPHNYVGVIDLDIVPPVERNTIPDLTQEQIKKNQERMAIEDSIRNAYIATFAKPENIRAFATSIKLDAKVVEDLVVASRGNHATLMKFLADAKDKNKALTLLQVISAKDLRDISLDVLNDHLNNTPSNVNNSKLYDYYVLNPRVVNEMVTPYKAFFQKVITKGNVDKFKANPNTLVDWCRKNISIDKDWNPQSLRMHPESVWTLKTADAGSRDIFFVAVARSLGITARIDEVTGKVQWADANDKWNDVQFGSAEQKNVEQGTLIATYERVGRVIDPKYYNQFTITKINEGGKLRLLDFSEGDGFDGILKNGLCLDKGNYLMTSGTRLANGSVLARLNFMEIKTNETTKTELSIRTSNDKVQVIGSFNSENKYFDLKANEEKSILSTTGRGYYIIGLINPTHEPTNHALRDIAQVAKEFEDWGGKIVLLFADKDAASRYNEKDFPGLPKTVVYGTDIDGKIAKEMTENMNLTSKERPLFLIADTFNRVVFMSQGYTIGLGEQLVNVLSHLND